MKQEVTCSECEKKTLSFIDHKDITAARWKIIGLSINTGLPIVTCNTCEWKPMSARQVVRPQKKTMPRDDLVAELERLI